MVFSSQLSLDICRRCLLSLLLGVSALPAVADKQVYYRYVDENGVQVLDHSIPPKYASGGYEVVSVSGKVIKTVEPTPDAETRARKKEEARIRSEYRRLTRRYASVDEIESAKGRRLTTLETNIAILRSNISGLKAQIESLMSQAADVERSGRDVPAAHLKKLEDTRAELKSTDALLKSRLREYDETAEEFDQAKSLYAKGQELVQTQ